MIEIDIRPPTGIDFMRLEWKFGPNYALDRNEEVTGSINKDGLRLNKR